MKRILVVGLLFALLTFTAAAALSIVKMSAQRQITSEHSNAFQASQKIKDLVTSVMNAETAWSAYAKNRAPRYRDAYNAALRETAERRDELKRIYSGEQPGKRRFENLFMLVNSRIEILRELLAAEQGAAGPEARVELLQREELIHNALLEAAQELEQSESAEMVALDEQMEKLSTQAFLFLLAGALLSVITFFGLFYSLYRELQERKRLEQTIKRQAHYDSLTGLPNRLSFMERLDYEITQANRSRERLAILFLDVDRFKDINDSLGHQAGDTLLRAVALRLRASVRVSDSVARIGGDEFNILLTTISDTADVSRIVEKVIDSFQRSVMIAGQEIHASASIGISIFPDDGGDAGVLLRHADIAMYHAKGQGGNRFMFFNQSLNSRIVERVKMEKRLRRTLEKNELVLHYQPLMDIRTKQIVCVEALVRWRHPELGLLNPLDFIPLAEGMGFISSLDHWVLRTACAQVRAWQERVPQAVRLAVNLSARLFKGPEFVNAVSEILDETGFDPRRLELEVPEQAAVEDIGNISSKLHELARLGVGVAIDHFGGGASSLRDLKRLSAGRIKIDRSFVHGIGSDRSDRAMIKAMIVMGHNLDARVVAEGVEQREQMSFLEANDCDEAQGYYLCSPLAVDEFTRFAASHAAQ